MSELTTDSATMPIASPPPSASPNGRPAPARLGEELPIFCERCGYQLFGLPQQCCEHCQILHFRCPECGHHQPINTLRPAFQRILGRLRAFALVCIIFFKINFFFWLLFAWGAMGVGWSYRYDWMAMQRAQQARNSPQMVYRSSSYQIPQILSNEVILAFTLFSIPFGIVSRLMLLRWRRGWAIALILTSLVLGAIQFGVWLRYYLEETLPWPWTADWSTLMFITAAALIFGVMIAWPTWFALVHLLVPKRAAAALIDWQRGLSAKVSSLAR